MHRTIVAATLLLGVMSDASPRAQDRSGNGEQAVTITVVNAAGQTVAVYWVDHDGEEQEYATLDPGEEFEVDWHNNILFRFKIGGRVVASYRTTASRTQQFTLRPQAPGRTAAATPAGSPENRPPRREASPASPPANRATTRDAVDSRSAIDANEAEALVGYHNKVRKEVNVGPVTWSPELAAVAQEWADRLAANGNLVHRPKQGPASSPYGENLAIDSTSMAGAAAWYGERADYTPGTLVTSANLSRVGHYTQMVWRQTTSIGCGQAIVQRGTYKDQVVLVCNYNPPGNFPDRPPY